MLFETPRLVCRRLTPADLDVMYAVYSDADAMRWVGDGQPISRDGCVQWIDITLNNYATRGYGMFALALRQGGSVVGFCGLVHPGGQVEVEIKYALRRAFWGMGLATEAVEGMLGYGRDVHGINRVIATVAPQNLASQRVLLKAGMRDIELRNNPDGSRTSLFEWNAPQSVGQASSVGGD